ncbi:hypothetical protein GALMADRAFT_1267206 [Galerina marginata CBS 339.88]|uniref:Uncharacterized protein n=1 Tax=Galerina marginata (strain CBS 339.88) TaxID=685588 RepID=A0A067T8Q2_GALM3|nr:hypothetical protein GALMADRAFT_1267206 [Galerina marginata CBS 339.88]
MIRCWRTAWAISIAMGKTIMLWGQTSSILTRLNSSTGPYSSNELSHPESATEHLTSPPLDKEVAQPDSPVLKIDDLPSPSENIPSPVSLNTVIEEPSQQVLSTSPSSSPLPSPRRISKMPALVDLTELTLHSPSSQIIGTPFATNSTRFEYPFPDTSSPSNPATGSNSPPLSSSALTFTNASGSSFPVISTSQSTSQISPPAISYSLSSSDAPSYNTTHPKLKAQLNSPVPPSLRKKRWSLNLLGRRKSSFGSDDSAGTTASIDTVLSGPPQHVASPPSSPREEGGKQ